MGIFGFLKTDPGKALAKAEALLERGDARAALQRAQALLAEGAFEHREQAEGLRDRAQEQILNLALERASQSEAAGFLDDAAQWLESALEQLDADDAAQAARRGGIEARLATLRERAEDEDEDEDGATDFGQAAAGGAGFSGDDIEIDLDLRYDVLVQTLTDEAQPLYRDRSAAFQRALVELNEGEAGPALETLDRLVAEEEATAGDPDPVLLLERGRARMLARDFEGAAEDLAIAWEELGDAPLSRDGLVTLPALWGEAMMELGEFATVAERLEACADRNDTPPTLVEVYGMALEEAGRLEDARDLWKGAAQIFPADPQFALQWALSLRTLGEPRDAILALEGAIAPSCATGNCSAPPKHLLSFRWLANLYLDEETRDLRRAGELLEAISLELRGNLTRDDVELAIRYHRAHGDLEETARLEAVLAELPEEQEGAEPEPSDPLAGSLSRKRAAL
jgi:tetratricopeptide (TPR) repeat protein